MKSYDVVGWVLDGEAYCPAHKPADLPDEQAYPIFADSEWDYYPVCGECRERIEDVSLTSDGAKYEHESAIDHKLDCPVPYCVECRSAC